MAELLYNIVEALRSELLGLIGGAIFFGSWIVQALESRRAKRSIVSVRFFLLRAIACLLMAAESVRVGSISLFVVMTATLVLVIYNIWLLQRNSEGISEKN